MLPIKIMFRNSAGGSGSLDTQTVTNGGGGVLPDRTRGFITGTMGSIADGTSNIYSGAAIRRLDFDENGGAPLTIFEVTGVVANSGWTTMQMGAGTIFSRAAATFSTAGGNSRWTWNGGVITDFGGVGANVVATFN
jgi:hypothetical protein